MIEEEYVGYIPEPTLAVSKIGEIIDIAYSKTSKISEKLNNTLAEESLSPLVTLDPKTGLVYDTEGRSTKSIMSALVPESYEYEEVKIPVSAIGRIQKQLKANSIGVASSTSMICTGVQCKIKDTCSYAKEDIYPVGKECLVERQLATTYMSQYIEEFNVDTSKKTEVELVSELVELDILDLRMSKYLNIHFPFLIQDNVASVDAVGNAHYNIEVSKIFDIKERIKKQRLKIYEAMIATRDQKASLVVSVANASSSLDKFTEVKKMLKEKLGRQR